MDCLWKRPDKEGGIPIDHEKDLQKRGSDQ